MVRPFILISLASISIFGHLAIAASTISLAPEDLPKWVREKNQNVTGSQLLVESAQGRTHHLMRSFIPELKLEAGGEAFQTGPYPTKMQPYGTAEVNINLFRGGRDLLEERSRDAQVNLSQGQALQTLANELIQARKLYWEIVFSRELIKMLESAVEQNEKLLELANRRISRGLSTETDKLEFQIHRSQLKEEIESLTHGLMLLQISLSAALGLTPDTRFTTADKIVHIHDEPLLSTAFESSTHPEVTVLKANYEIAYSQKSKTNRWWVPSLDGYAGYYLYTLRDRDYLNQKLREDQVIGFKLTFNLFDGFQSRSNARALSLEAQGFEAQAAQRALSVTAQIEVSKEDLKHDHELIHQSEERIEQGKKYLSRTLEEYNRGVKGSSDALGAAQKALEFERQYAERRRNYQLTKSGLLALLGQ